MWPVYPVSGYTRSNFLTVRKGDNSMHERAKLTVRSHWSLLFAAGVSVALAMTLTPLSASASTLHSVSRTSSSSLADSGGFFVSASQKAAETPQVPRTPANGQCTGEWKNKVSNVFYRRGTSGRLYWDFYLTDVAIEKLGPVVAVDIVAATIDGKAINTPYSEHVKAATYDFHGSLLKYNYFRSKKGGTIKTGDKLDFVWFIEGSSGEDAYRYTFCKIPKPGVG
jgi:hypothetical protein